MEPYNIVQYCTQIPNQAYNSLNVSNSNCVPSKMEVHAAGNSCKCEDMEKKIEEIKVCMQQQMNTIQGQLTLALEALQDQKELMQELLKTREEKFLEQSLPLHSKFPLKTEDDLYDLDDDITPQNRNLYIKAISSLIYPEGIGKNLRNIICDSLTQEYNIDGVHGKKSFKTLDNFYNVLLEAIPVTSTSGSQDVQLRKAIQLQKRRYFKNLSISKKHQNVPEEEEDIYDSDYEEKPILRKRFKNVDPLEVIHRPREREYKERDRDRENREREREYRERERESSIFAKFPLNTERQLIDLNESINAGNKSLYVKVMRSLLNPNGVKKNLRNIISQDITQAYNMEGVHGKKSFKSLSNFYQTLMESIVVTTESGTADVQLRAAIQLQKKRHFKKISIEKKKSQGD